MLSLGEQRREVFEYDRPMPSSASCYGEQLDDKVLTTRPQGIASPGLQC